MLSGVKAGLVSADVLRREQQELRRHERNHKHLEGRAVTTLREHPLAFPFPAFSCLLMLCQAPVLGWWCRASLWSSV